MNILDLLKKLGIKADGRYLITCPLPGHIDDTPSFKVYPATNSYFCFGCHRSGDPIQFFALYKKISREESKKRLGLDDILVEIEELQKPKAAEEMDFNTELNYNISKLVRAKLQSGSSPEKIFVFIKQFDKKLTTEKFSEEEAKNFIIQAQKVLNEIGSNEF